MLAKYKYMSFSLHRNSLSNPAFCLHTTVSTEVDVYEFYVYLHFFCKLREILFKIFIVGLWTKILFEIKEKRIWKIWKTLLDLIALKP
jgi:hypothetical protein